jgi:hypothetical protein
MTVVIPASERVCEQIRMGLQADLPRSVTVMKVLCWREPYRDPDALTWGVHVRVRGHEKPICFVLHTPDQMFPFKDIEAKLMVLAP